MATYANGKCVVFHAEDWTAEQIAAAKAKTAAFDFNSGWLADMNSKGEGRMVTDAYGETASGTYGRNSKS